MDYAMQFTETSQKLKELNLLERCIKETLRIYPSVPVFTRRLTSPLELGNRNCPHSISIWFIYQYYTVGIPVIIEFLLKEYPDTLKKKNLIFQKNEKKKHMVCVHHTTFTYIFTFEIILSILFFQINPLEKTLEIKG